ncbi:hypothetical protein IT41_08525 [Paracoccus halophilus]|uniref:Peptidoglycan peptidase n=1 Tax=Paracoccus halophilus TaxID=376733 RepID=A0A099F3U7_9RHOB|nr:hypothetical protein IT41_08525 [Paracoccus halophilus]
MAAVLAGILTCAASWAQDRADPLTVPAPDYEALMAEAAWDWRPGDLIFRNGVNDIDEAIRRSLDLRWASVGILRPSSGGPRVVFVDESEGVKEEMLYEHVAGLSHGDYAVYRARDLAADYDPEEQMWPGPMARFSLFIAYGQPFDDQFLLGDGRFYNAELAYQGLLNAGIVAGPPVQLGRLVSPPGQLEPQFRSLLEGHRYCRYELSFDDCWANNLQGQAIVTTGSLISSGALERVYP